MQKSPVILIVEDNPGDIRLIKEALKTSSFNLNLYFVLDGVEALQFLETKKREPSNNFPQLIVLDLNLPKKSGFEVLQVVKRDERLKRIPVIILSSSQNPEDIARAYDLHANCYLNKASNFEAYIDLVKALEYFWAMMSPIPSTHATRLYS